MSALWRAFVLLSLVLDVPVLRGIVRRLTATPRDHGVVGGAPTLTPGRGGPWPAYVFVNGAHPERRREPVVARLLEGLARAGYVVAAPEPTGLGDGRITLGTLEETVLAIECIASLPQVRQGAVGVLGVSTGASLGLLAGADPRVRDSLSVVVAVTPFASLERIIRLGVTGSYRTRGLEVRREVPELLEDGVVRSLIATLSDPMERERLCAALGPRPMDAIAQVDSAELTREAAGVVRMLSSRDTGSFDRGYHDLPPQLKATIDALSPLSVAGLIRAPVELVVPPEDLYFPRDEVLALKRELALSRLTVTPTLDHTRPSFSRSQLGAFVEFVRFAIRGLRAPLR